MLRSYEHLGLYWNPFGCPPPALWARLCVTDIDLEELGEGLARPGFAVIFRGRAGRGKSTHLRALHHHFSDRPYTYLAPDASANTSIPKADVHFVDEVQRLGTRQRRRLFRRRASLALASHEDLREPLARLGYEVRDIELRGLELGRLAEIVEHRLHWSARYPKAPAAGLLDCLAMALPLVLEEHGDDLRSIQDQLFDHVESLRGQSPSLEAAE